MWRLAYATAPDRGRLTHASAPGNIINIINLRRQLIMVAHHHYLFIINIINTINTINIISSSSGRLPATFAETAAAAKRAAAYHALHLRIAIWMC